MSGPRSPHLEIRTASLAGAELVAAVAAQEDVLLQVRDRGRHAAAYAKGAEPIADALALMGAGDTALSLDEHAVVAEARARANRVANADHANLVRTSRAARAQIRAIRQLEAEGALARLSPPLAEVAELRLRYPSASLRELAAKCRPPATKAAAHRRLNRSDRTWFPTDLATECSFEDPILHTLRSGSALVRRWIQTPSAGSVLSAVQPEGRVVLGASPPARCCIAVLDATSAANRRPACG